MAQHDSHSRTLRDQLEQQLNESTVVALHDWHRITKPVSGHSFPKTLGLYGRLAGHLLPQSSLRTENVVATFLDLVA